MKNFTLTALLTLTLHFFASAQMPQLQWANSLGIAADNEMGIKFMPDNNGNLFFYGRFSGTVDFDPGAGITNLTAGGNHDIVIGKYDPSGALLWVKKIGGSVIATYNGHSMIPYDATVDAAGDLYITGLYVGPVDIDPSGASYLLNPPPGIGGERIFVASYTNTGDFKWGFGYGAEDVLSGHWNAGYSLKIDHAGDVVVSGMFHHTCDFDPSGSTFELTANGAYMDIFFAKYSNTGNFIWAKNIDGTGIQDTPTDLIIDSSNNIYLSGYFDLTADFDPSAATATKTSNGGGGDAFVAKYNAMGDYQWAFSAGAAVNYDVATCMTFDHDGNICVSGYFRGSVDFDPSAATMILTSTGTTNADAFLAKYTTTGNLVWVKSFGGTGHENLVNMLTDQYGRILITGDFTGICDFDPSPLTETVDAGTAPNGAFTVQFDQDGNFLQVMPIFGADSYLFVHGMAMDDNENIYFTGGFEGAADFDPSASVHNLTSTSSYQDIYMSKYQVGTGALRGAIWNDANTNGVQDLSEQGIPNIKVGLVYDRNNNGLVDSYDGIINTKTLADGSYEFKFVAQGNYLLSVLPQPGYTNTTPLISNADITNGQVINAANFGFNLVIIPAVCADFSATAINAAIKIQWKTLTEINSKGFNLQRSIDGLHFENIAWIAAKGNATGSYNYSYNDPVTGAENNYYYRLQEISISGHGKFICSVLHVRPNIATGTISIYPNPVADQLNVVTGEGYKRILLTDVTGRKIYDVNVNTVNRVFAIPTKGLEAGMYMLTMYHTNGQVFSRKILKK